MDVITQPTLINIVYPIEVFDFHQLIRYPTLQGVGISPSVFLVASVECLIPVCLCIGEVVPAPSHRYLLVIDIS